MQWGKGSKAVLSGEGLWLLPTGLGDKVRCGLCPAHRHPGPSDLPDTQVPPTCPTPRSLRLASEEPGSPVSGHEGRFSPRQGCACRPLAPSWAFRPAVMAPLRVLPFPGGLLEGKTSFKVLRNKTPVVGFRGPPVRRCFWRDSLFLDLGPRTRPRHPQCLPFPRAHRQGAPQGPCS